MAHHRGPARLDQRGAGDLRDAAGDASGRELRGQLGAHFTPRAFVERLVLPTVIEPLRAEWDGYKAASDRRLDAGDRAGAAAVLWAFHGRLCTVRVLDPACGTGNFLYVTMELMKRLEGEVLDALANVEPGENSRLVMGGASVDPHQFLGIEEEPARRAGGGAGAVDRLSAMAFPHHRRRAPAEPILRDFRNIQHGDALLTHDGEVAERGKDGRLLTRWDGRTMKPHPITGANVPDETVTIEVTRLVRPRPAAWPEADFRREGPFRSGRSFIERSRSDHPWSDGAWSAAVRSVPV